MLIMRNGNSAEWLAEVESRIKLLQAALKAGNMALASHQSNELFSAAGILHEELKHESFLRHTSVQKSTKTSSITN